MTLREALSRAGEILVSGGIEDAALEAQVLLMYLLDISRAGLYTDAGNELEPGRFEEYMALVGRRLKGEPAAYITGKREFYGLDFFVDTSVLIPRPETELLVETAIGLAAERGYRTIADVGTGSGCVAVCLALNLREVKIFATDISPAAIETARKNCRRYGVDNSITLLEGDMLEPLPVPVDMIVANLPYVSESEIQHVNTVPFEPEAALNGGEDGLEKIISLCRQSMSKLLREGAVCIEVGMGQAEIAARQFQGMFPYGKLEILKDLSGIDRVVTLCLPKSARLKS